MNTIKKITTPKIMNVVNKKQSHKANAVKTEETVDEIIKRFIDKNKIEYACLFVVGINTGSRISDIVPYRVCDILNDDGQIEDEITIIEQKTKKERTIPFNPAAKLAFEIMLQKKEYPDEFIFTGSGNKKVYFNTIDGRRIQKPLTRQSVWNNLMSITEDLDGHYSTHAMRKTFANFFTQIDTSENNIYVDGRNVTALTKALNHSSPTTTMTYMDIQQMELSNMYNSLNLGYDVLKKYYDERID